MAERVGIIGGGFSGLLSAYLLERMLGERAEIVVLEQSDRVGGRVRTTQLPEASVSYEAGVAELYDITGNPLLRSLIRHLGLETRPLSGTPYFVVDDGVVHDDLELERLVGSRGMDRLRRFWEHGTALRPPADYALAGQMRDNLHPWLRRTFEDVLAEIDDPFCQWFTAMQCHCDLATEPPLTSGLFGMDNLLIDHPGYCSMYTLVGGNDGLVQALASRIQCSILRSAPVASVTADTERGLRVTFRVHGDERSELDVDTLIVTLPPRGIRAMQWSDDRLAGAVSEHVRHHDHGTMYLRVTLLFRRRFWRRQFPEDYFVTDAFGGVTVYDQSPDDGAAGVGIQSWLLGGANARDLSARSDDEIVAAVLAAMPSELQVRDGMLVRGCVDRWAGASGVSRLPGGVPLRPLDQRHSPDPRWPQLQFVGDYLYDSTLCGALDAVLYAVARVGERVEARTGEPVVGAPVLFAAPGADVAGVSPASPSSAFFLDERFATRR